LIVPRNENPTEKTHALGAVVKVQQVIDFIVLSHLLEKGRLYHSQMEQFIVDTLQGVGANDAYFSQRLKVLAETGHVNRHWDGDNRYNRFYDITDKGEVYLKQLLGELPDRVKLAQRVYTLFDKYISKFGKMNLK
jgi:DNA-binding PadR family transcriptional regulator